MFRFHNTDKLPFFGQPGTNQRPRPRVYETGTHHSTMRFRALSNVS